jgi:uncharacterized repeat protein (TIGR01451 family)
VSYAQQESGKLDLKTTGQKEIKIKQEGKEIIKKIPLDKVNLGDTVIYTITYTNAGNGLLKNAVITDPIPQGVRYIENTAEGKDTEITCSIDNGLTWQKPPVMTEFRKPDGTLEKKKAPMDMYTHIKWEIKKPVAPGEADRVSFKVTVK